MKQLWELALIQFMLDRIEYAGAGFWPDEREFIREWFWSLKGVRTP